MKIGWIVSERIRVRQGGNSGTCREIVIEHSVAVAENRSSDRSNTIRDCDACKGVAVGESIVTDRGNTIRDCDACKGVAAGESIIADRCNIFTNGNIFQHITIYYIVVSVRTHHAIRR